MKTIKGLNFLICQTKCFSKCSFLKVLVVFRVSRGHFQGFWKNKVKLYFKALFKVKQIQSDIPTLILSFFSEPIFSLRWLLLYVCNKFTLCKILWEQQNYHSKNFRVLFGQISSKFLINSASSTRVLYLFNTCGQKSWETVRNVAMIPIGKELNWVD